MIQAARVDGLPAGWLAGVRVVVSGAMHSACAAVVVRDLRAAGCVVVWLPVQCPKNAGLAVRCDWDGVILGRWVDVHDAGQVVSQVCGVLRKAFAAIPAPF